MKESQWICNQMLEICRVCFRFLCIHLKNLSNIDCRSVKIIIKAKTKREWKRTKEEKNLIKWTKSNGTTLVIQYSEEKKESEWWKQQDTRDRKTESARAKAKAKKKRRTTYIRHIHTKYIQANKEIENSAHKTQQQQQ